MQDMKLKAKEAFEKHFGQKAQYVSYAPGRVNLIGEHTDYNDGFVMPCAIKYGTAIAARKNGTNKIRAIAVDIHNQTDEFEISKDLQKDEKKTWSNYLRGVCKLICQEFSCPEGLDIAICGDIPLGSGLSSSASLEVSFGNLLSFSSELDIPLQKIALIGQAAEAFIGCKCGIMDQTICACGMSDHALVIDCRTLELTQVKVPQGLEILIINSNIKHQLVGSEYNDRREQCESAARKMGIKALRDGNLQMLNEYKNILTDVEYRRAHHVITEDNRVLEAIDAFKNADLKKLSELMYASHVSMRDDFEITIKEIDALVEIVRKAIGENAAVRMTGGGFGGSIVAVVEPNKIPDIIKAVDEQYELVSGKKATIIQTHATAGAHVDCL